MGLVEAYEEIQKRISELNATIKTQKIAIENARSRILAIKYEQKRLRELAPPKVLVNKERLENYKRKKKNNGKAERPKR